MDRETMLESAHMPANAPVLNGVPCRNLSATNYALLRKHMDDSGAVQTIQAAFILAAPRDEVFSLAAKPEEFLIAALEFGDRLEVRELDRFAEWLGERITHVKAAQTEDLPGKPQGEGKETPHAG